MTIAPILTRLAIEAYYQPKMRPDSSKQWSYTNTYSALTTLLALPEVDSIHYRPVSHCYCLGCGNVLPLTGLVTQTLFHRCCYRCYDELPTADLRRILHLGHGSREGWNAIESVLVMHPNLLAEYEHYLQNLWLTGCNPFEIIIESYKIKLSNVYE